MIWAGMALSALLMGGTTAQAQSGVTMYGSLANFDVQNNTGQEAYGFESEIHGSMTGVRDVNCDARSRIAVPEDRWPRKIIRRR